MVVVNPDASSLVGIVVNDDVRRIPANRQSRRELF